MDSLPDRIRQDELEVLLREGIAANPALKEALDIFQISQAEYLRALQGFRNIVYLHSNQTDYVEDGQKQGK